MYMKIALFQTENSHYCKLGQIRGKNNTIETKHTLIEAFKICYMIAVVYWEINNMACMYNYTITLHQAQLKSNNIFSRSGSIFIQRRIIIIYHISS